MFLIINAIKNYKRYKSRIILNFTILFLISVICSIAYLLIFSCNASMKKIENDLDKRYVISDSFGYYAVTSNFGDAKADRDDILKLFESAYIDDFILTNSIIIQIKEFYNEFYNTHPEMQNDDQYIEVHNNAGSILKLKNVSELMASTITLEGYYDLNIDDVIEFEYGINKLTEGRFVEADNEIVISDQLANEKGIKTGNIITTRTQSEQQLKVVGIYTTQHEVYDLSMTRSIGLRSMKGAFNELKLKDIIYTSFNTVYNLYDNKYEITYSNYYPVFIINDKNNAELLDQEFQQSGDMPAPVKVLGDRATYGLLTKKVGDLSRSLSIASILCIAIGVLVLLLFSLLLYNSRKYENAVLCSMGMNKIKIIFGLFIENFIFIIFTLSIGLLIARIISPYILNNYLGDLIAWFEIKVTISMQFLFLYVLFAFSLLLITTLAFFITMIRYSPLKLLAEEK